jgi:hypothetical protein
MKFPATLLALYGRHARRAFAAAACLCAACAFLYGFFLLEAVGHAASRAAAAEASHELRSKLSMLESRYLSATQALTPERAEAMGLKAPQSVAVVYATVPARALTLAAPLSSRPEGQ